MSTLFFENINIKLKEILDYPVPVVLLRESKSALNKIEHVNPGENNNNFLKSSEIGEIGEVSVIKYLMYTGQQFISHSVGSDGTHDVVMKYKNRELKYEIKTDVWHAVTKNVAIELGKINKNTGEFELTGINVWNCDYIVYVFPQKRQIAFIQLKDLKELYTIAKDNIEMGYEKDKMGDDKRTTNFLVKYKYFETYINRKGNKIISL